jgi:hypothetical protein
MVRPKIKQINKRSKMRSAQQDARDYLISNGYKWIFIKEHTRFPQMQVINGNKQFQQDILGLFDGIAFDSDGVPCFLQIKANDWASEEDIRNFINGKHCKVIVINVKDSKHYKQSSIDVREYIDLSDSS